MRKSAVAAAVVVAALAAGAGTALVWDARADAAAAASQDRVASALAAGEHDERAAAQLADRSSGIVSRSLLASAHADLAAQVPEAQAVLDASAGQVADEAVRERLAAALAAALAVLDAGAAPALAEDASAELAAASAAVSAAQQEWLAARAAQEAAIRTAQAPTGNGSPAPVCTVPAQEPFFTSIPAEDGDGSNGNLPRSAMKVLPWSDEHGSEFWLVAEATDALIALNDAFRLQFGHDIDLDLTYRDYCTQVAMGQYYGYPRAARPGTSNHGWGKAIDVPEWPDQYGYGTPMHTWLAQNGPAYGWHEQPQKRGSEYWHFDYTG